MVITEFQENSKEHAAKGNLFDYIIKLNTKKNKSQQNEYIDVGMCECNATPDLINYIFFINFHCTLDVIHIC